VLAEAVAAQCGELAAARHWYVGFSGGVDSTVLLHLLHGWCRGERAAPPLTAVHVNHGLHAAADAWEAHCRRVCARMELPLLARRVAAAGGEAGARAARYRVFEELLATGGVLFLAHHQDDQVETFFLRLLRGAGTQGLAGMERRRPLAAGVVARPLLDQPRAAIEACARAGKLSWVRDPSNDDTALARNFLRAEVLPLIARQWPAYRRTVARAAGHLGETAALLREELGVPPTVYSATGDPGLALAALREASASSAARRLRDWLRLAGLQAPAAVALGEFLRQLRGARASARPRLDTGRYALQRFRDGVYLEPSFDAGAPAHAMVIRPGDSLEIAGVGRVALAASPGGMALPAGETLHLAWRRGGERCRVRGRGSVPLKQLLQEAGVPPWWRPRLPLLYCGGELIAVADFACCDGGAGADCAPGDAPRWRLLWERDRGQRQCPGPHDEATHDRQLD